MEIDLIDPDIYERGGPPHDQFAWLREHAPVFWHEHGGAPGWPGFWAVTRHDEIEQVARRPEIFSSARRTSNFYELPAAAVERRRLGILNADPPQHTRLRGLVNRGFTPRVIGLLENRVAEICCGLLDEVTPERKADFVADIAAPLPVQVISELVGAPLENSGMLYELTNRMTGVDDPQVSSPSGFVEARREMFGFAAGLAQRRRQQPRDDIVTRLLQPDDDKDELTAAEFGTFFLTLIVAGNETTRNAAPAACLPSSSIPSNGNACLPIRP
jgi:cholest-4-en-3-one 26-monooxygenase